MANDPTEPTEGSTKEGSTEPTAAADSQVEGEDYSPDELANGSPNDDQPAADINVDLILEVPVSVSLQVGSAEITIHNLVQLVEGSVVALDRGAAEPMDVLVNGVLIAHGEIVVVDKKFGVRLTDVVSPAERIRNLN